MNEISSHRPEDDIPTAHSSTDDIVPRFPDDPEPTIAVRPKAGSSEPFRDAVEFQSRAQDIAESGDPNLPLSEAYHNSGGDPSEDPA